MPAHRRLREGEVLLGKYRILGLAGEGGMAYVYRAKSEGVPGFSRPVVIKVIRPELASSKELVRQFVQEASVGASLDHPNVVQVFDFFEHEGMLLMVLEYVAGKDLAALCYRARRSRRVLGPEVTAFVAIDVCKALECAHGRVDASGNPDPIVHRDVSPQNILLAYDGHTKLADFGLARALGAARQTQQGVIKGKLSYMSPEQSRGADVDARSDVFSLGTVMWETLTGRRLFLAESQAETIKRVRDAEAPPPHAVAPHVPFDLSAIVVKALAKAPEERFAAATQVRQALQGFLRSARHVDQTTVAGLLEAYFPTEDLRTETADAALAFDDESDLHGGSENRDTVIELQPPSMGEDDAGLLKTHTIVLEDPTEIMSSPGELAPEGAAPPKPGAAAVALGGGKTRLGMPPPRQPPPAGAPAAAPDRPGGTPEQGAPATAAGHHGRQSGRRGHLRPVVVSLILGVPMGIGVGFLVYWLLSR